MGNLYWRGMLIREGDEVEVALKGRITEIGATGFYLGGTYVHDISYVLKDLKFIRPPIKVGDRVKLAYRPTISALLQSDARFIVLGIDGSRAWIKQIGVHDGYMVEFFDKLEQAE